MDNNEIKLTTDEQAEIIQLNQEYQDVLIAFGELHLKKMQLKAEEESLVSTEQEYKESYIEVEKKEFNFKERLTNKYGPGEIDVQSGIYIKNQK